jgi:phosphatidylinositol kinase/protein kinase (PI-3  family)
LLQALLVGRELIRVAILWHELWHEGLEEASRHFFTEKNPDAMIAALEPLHDMLEQVNSSGFAALNTEDCFRVRQRLARPLLLKYLGGSCMKLERLVVDGGSMATRAN